MVDRRCCAWVQDVVAQGFRYEGGSRGWVCGDSRTRTRTQTHTHTHIHTSSSLFTMPARDVGQDPLATARGRYS